MKRLAMLAAACATAIAVAASAAATPAGPGGATSDDQPHGIHLTPLSHATIGSRVHAHSSGIEIETRGPRDLLVTSIVVDPGGSFGWHTHPGPVLVAVSAGMLDSSTRSSSPPRAPPSS